MTERERLIELLQTAPHGSGTLGEYFNKSYIDNCIVEHLLANGVIVPPCKVGDKVYVVSQGQGFNMRWDVYEGKVTDIHINCHSELEIRAENGEKFFGYYKPCFVFLTKEEAEQALKGGAE